MIRKALYKGFQMRYHLILDICIVCNHVVYILKYLSISKEEKKGCQLEVGHTHVISHTQSFHEKNYQTKWQLLTETFSIKKDVKY